MASFQKRENKNGTIAWRVDIRIKGFPETTKTFHDLEEAKEWAKITEKSIYESKKGINPTMREIFDRYEKEVLPLKSFGQQSDEKRHLIFWREKISRRIARDILPLEIEEIADEIYQIPSRVLGQTLTAESRRKYLMTLSFIFNTACIKWKWISSNPVSFVDKHEERLKKQRNTKKCRIDICDVEKGQFISSIQERMKQLNLSSFAELSRYSGMPKETVRRIMTPNIEVTFFKMIALAKRLDMEIKFTYSLSKPDSTTPTQ